MCASEWRCARITREGKTIRNMKKAVVAPQDCGDEEEGHENGPEFTAEY